MESASRCHMEKIRWDRSNPYHVILALGYGLIWRPKNKRIEAQPFNSINEQYHINPNVIMFPCPNLSAPPPIKSHLPTSFVTVKILICVASIFSRHCHYLYSAPVWLYKVLSTRSKPKAVTLFLQGQSCKRDCCIYGHTAEDPMNNMNLNCLTLQTADQVYNSGCEENA